ncbi:hypothetical protein PISMIDRAFT_11288 [Pisolithus microcarpus 441]|uniref:Uncharacterized protein n=1 Tax=Pisolithus microcarpus 441 TaxID=765257 RepID=A0A0C9YDM8_9AGAM|nr:hypothetical protein BKA83DRAFT_11288 [Pisolithus microcarpus]KIK22920.1 hypothetical protein PISMIDRAFT_11288 [Pisolithus microcarpus 441]
MAPSIRLTRATLNNAAFALLEQYVNGEITDMAALTKIDVELDIAGIPFDQEEWLDLIKAKVVPLLEDAAVWQLVLWWAGDDGFSFDSFLQEMQDRFKERYKFDNWKTIFDQVFKASCEGTAVELVRAAMSEHGVLNPPSVPNLSSSQALSSGKVSRKSDSSLPPAKHARLSKSMARYLDVSTREDEDDENEDGDQDNLDIGVENHPKVTEVGPSGRATFNECLQDLVQHYVHEGGVAGLNAQVRQNWVPNVESCPPSPLASAARFILEHLKLENLPCQTFCLLPKHIFVEARNPLEVQICLPPSHNTLVKNIVLIPAEEMRSITQPHDIPIRSWVCHLSSPFKNNISYVLSTDADSMEMLVVPQEVPYYSTPQDLFHGHTLFDVDLARAHGLEVMVSTDEEGNKGKSKAQESEVAGGDGGIEENSDLIQVSVSIDDAIIIPPSTLQLSKERGYDVSIGNCVQVAHGPAVGAEGPVHAVNFASGRLTVLSEDGPWHNVPISFCVKVEDYTLRDQEYHIGHEVWIISGPSKGYRGMLRSLKNTAVVTESGMLLNGTPFDSTRMAAFIALHRNLFAEIAPPPHHATPPPSLSAVDPLAEPGPSTSTSNPWIVSTDDVTMPHPNETEKQQIDYGT